MYLILLTLLVQQTFLIGQTVKRYKYDIPKIHETWLKISQASKKHLESSLDLTRNFCQNLVIFRSKNMCLRESLTRFSTVMLLTN